MSSIDDLQLQRLIDGRLGLRDMQTLLQGAETHSEQWRQIALAFVEEQMWQRQLGFEPTVVHGQQGSQQGGPTDQAPQADKNAVAHRLGQFLPEHGLAIGPLAADEYRNGMGPARASVAVWWSVAALLLLMPMASFWAGRNMGRERGELSPSGDGAASIAAPSASDPLYSSGVAAGLPGGASSLPQRGLAMDSGTQRAESEDYPMINAPYSLQLTSGSQPVGSAPLLTESMARQLNYRPVAKPISEELQARYRQRGYELSPDIHYLKGATEDGREIILPVEYIRLKKFGI